MTKVKKTLSVKTTVQEPIENVAPKHLDIVIPYVTSTVVWHELIYALRSIEKYAQFDYRLFLVSDKLPAWANPEHVNLIPIKQIEGQQFSKAFDQWRKIFAVLDHKNVSENFVYAYDDQIWLKMLDQSFFDQTKSSPLVKTVDDLEKTVPTAGVNWRTIFMNTVDLLLRKDKPTYNYETHIPRAFSQINIMKMIAKYGITEDSPTLLSTLYYNEYASQDPDPVAPLRLVIKENLSSDQINAKLIDKVITFIDYNNDGLNSHLQNFIAKNFDAKSKFEL